MSNAKRYGFFKSGFQQDTNVGHFQPHKEGDYVLHSDYLLKCAENERLREALEKISSHGNHSGVISCPQDYEFYIAPMQRLAREALKPPPADTQRRRKLKRAPMTDQDKVHTK
jgi:hypothetical protein